MRFGQRALALCMGVALVGAGGLLAQEPGGTPRTEVTVRRVPPYFGQVGLSPQQKEAIYSIRSKYAGRAADLKRQLEELREQELTECESVLTPAQKAQLQERRAASGKSRAKAEPKNAEAGN